MLVSNSMVFTGFAILAASVYREVILLSLMVGFGFAISSFGLIAIQAARAEIDELKSDYKDLVGSYDASAKSAASLLPSFVGREGRHSSGHLLPRIVPGATAALWLGAVLYLVLTFAPKALN
jgi:hypothetical protein